MRFSCPTCSQLMECADTVAGSKVKCPKCGQRLLVPAPPEPVASPKNKTVLGHLEEEPIPTALHVEDVPSVIPVEEQSALSTSVGIAVGLLLTYSFLVMLASMFDMAIATSKSTSPDPATMAFGGARLLSAFAILGASGLLLLRWRVAIPLVLIATTIDLCLCIAERLYVFLIAIPAARSAQIEGAARAAEANKDMDIMGGPGNEIMFDVGKIMGISNVVVTVISVGVWLLFCVSAFVLIYTDSTKKR